MRSPSPTFEDLLITGDGAGTESNGASGLQLTGGGIINNVAIHGFAGAGCRSDAGQTIVSANTSFLISGVGRPRLVPRRQQRQHPRRGRHGCGRWQRRARHLLPVRDDPSERGRAINSYGNALNGGNFQSSRYYGGGGAFTYNGGNGVAGYLSTLDLLQTNAGRQRQLRRLRRQLAHGRPQHDLQSRQL